MTASTLDNSACGTLRNVDDLLTHSTLDKQCLPGSWEIGGRSLAFRQGGIHLGWSHVCVRGRSGRIVAAFVSIKTHVQVSGGASVYGGGASNSEEGGRGGAEGGLRLLAAPSSGCLSSEAMSAVGVDH